MKDTVKINDRYNRLNELIVCRADVDKTNPQDRPFNMGNEAILANPTYVRPRQSLTYVNNENDDRLPGAPTNGQALVNPLSNTIDLFWDAPSDNGSSAIIGYLVQRASPQLGYYLDLSSNTETSSTYFNDATSTLSEFASYQVSAINTFGTGPVSSPIFWPTPNYLWLAIEYIVAGDGTAILDGNGDFLVTNVST